MPRQQLLVSDVNMTIGGILLPLSGEAQKSLELITSDNVARSVIQVLGRDNVENLVVDVSLITPSLRKLAEGEDDNDSLLLDMLIMIQSVIRVHNANRYILGAFNGKAEKEMFLQSLKETGHIEFASVESVSVAPVKDVVKIIPEDDTANENGSRTVLAVALPIVIGAILAVAAGIVFYRRKKESRESDVFRSNHGNVNDDDGSKINMVVNTTMDTGNMSILEEPIFGGHNSDMMIDVGEVSTIGDPSMNNSLFGGSRSGDFDLKHMHIQTNILDDEMFYDEEELPNARKSKAKGTIPVGSSDDGSSAVGSMSVMSTPMSVDYDFHKSHQVRPKTIVSGTLPTSYDDFYASQELLGMKEAPALLKIPTGFSDDASSAMASKSILGDNCSFDYDYYKSNEGPVGENKVATPSEPSTDSLKDSDSGAVLLDDTFSLGRELDAVYASPAPTEEDFSVADSMPRIPETLPYGESKMEAVNEDVTVTDSLPSGNVKLGIVVNTNAVHESDSRVSGSLSTDIDFQRSKQNANYLPEDENFMNDTLSFDYSFTRKYSRNSSLQEAKDSKWEVASSIPTSDASYAAHFEVSAPKGSLGLTLEASSLGVPAVVMLKSTSPLSRKVRTGDWLIKVDGMDVTSMKASDVNRLISSKKNQPVRRFVFARTLDGMEGEIDSVYEA